MAEILVLAEHDGGEVKKVTYELITLARRFGEPAVVWTGPGAGEGQPGHGVGRHRGEHDRDQGRDQADADRVDQRPDEL